MPKCHILSEFTWPDGAPTAIYADQLAETLTRHGVPAVRVGGTGCYRKTSRPRPDVQTILLDHHQGLRGNLLSTARSYLSVTDAFNSYIRESVHRNDVVIITSAPPLTVHLAPLIRRQQAVPLYWLQDYYPELVAGLNYPKPLRTTLGLWWHLQLQQWDTVIKIGTNLAYHGQNAVVIRNWPTLTLGPARDFVPGRVLYAGNLGYGHCLTSFLDCCRRLKTQGFSVMVRGDGPGLSRLPAEIDSGPSPHSEQELINLLWSADTHLIAAHPHIQGAVFPSKFWNARATGRPIHTCGFAGTMEAELALARNASIDAPKDEWLQLITSKMPADRS